MPYPAIFLALRNPAILVLAALMSTAAASAPLLIERNASQVSMSAEAPRLSDSELVDAQAAHMDMGETTSNLPSTSSGPVQAWGTSADALKGFASPSSTSLAFDALRGFVNVPAEGFEANTGRSGPRRPTGRPDDMALIVAPEAQAWIHDAVRNIVNSTLELHEREGHTTFSVLGQGNFGLMVSADRSEVAFVSGEDVLFSAHRMPYPQTSSHAAGGYSDRDPFGGSSGPGPVRAPTNENPLQQVVEIAAEISTHPISLLVYIIVAIYALLWSVLSRQARKAPRHARSRSRSRSHAAPADQAPAPQRTGRKRRRFRTRRAA